MTSKLRLESRELIKLEEEEVPKGKNVPQNFFSTFTFANKNDTPFSSLAKHVSLLSCCQII
jgi:hypothetical protein